jgi:hypothetical protein
MHVSRRHRSPRLVSLTSLTCLTLAAAVAGCGGGDSGSNNPSQPPAGGGSLSILYSKAYTAYDGVHTFKVPVMVNGVTGVTWSAEPALVDIEAVADDGTNTGSEAMLTTKGAGTVTLKARAGNLEGTAVITISQAAADAWEVGSARYNDGVSLRPTMPMPGMPPTVNKAAACTNCHGTQMDDVEHTPAQIGGYSDAEVITIFTEGKKPPGVINRIIPAAQWSPIHQWVMSEEEKAGVLVYLRALAPQSQGTLDFGGQGVFRGPGGPRGDGGMGGFMGDGGPRPETGGAQPDAGASD